MKPSLNADMFSALLVSLMTPTGKIYYETKFDKGS